MTDVWDQFPDAPAPKRPPASPIGPFPGMVEQGNIDLNARPIVKNADGSYSTVRSMSLGEDGKEILVPTVSPDGKILPDQAASDLYGQTGQNLGKFDNPAHADMYAEALHKAQDQHYGADAGGDAWAAFPDAPATPEAPAPDAPSGNNLESLIRGTEQAPAAPALTPHSAPVDFAYSMAAGVPRGAVEMGMLPVTAARAVKGAGQWAQDKVEDPIRSLFGYDAVTPEEKAQREADDKNSYLGGFLQRMFDGQDAVRGKMDDMLYEPRGTAGEYGRTIGEFAMPGSLAGKAGTAATTGREVARNVAENAVGNVILPAVASEGAGRAAEGTGYEGLSRFLGALFGNAGVAAGRSLSAPEAFVRRATGDMTDADWAAAKALQDNKTGVQLSGPEAIAEAKGGASAMPDILRIVEGSVEGRARTAPFFAQRPEQIKGAVGNVLDEIAPQHLQPSTLGPSAAEAAGNVIDSARKDINDQTRPLYQAAEGQTVPAGEFAKDPRYVAGVERLRGNTELAPDYMTSPVGPVGPVTPGPLPANSLKVVDAVTKDLNARGEVLANKDNPLYGPELAGKSKAAAADARDAATTSSPEYAQALAEQEALRRTVLNPLEQGPVGRVAAAKDTTGAGNALLPHDPLTGSAGEAADATKRLVAEDPETTKALIRQNIADRHSKAATETAGNSLDNTGGKLHKDLAGNDARKEVLDAVLREASPKAGISMKDLLEVLHATGWRQAIGSRTAFNAAGQEALGSASPAAAVFDIVKSVGGSIINKAGDATKRAALRGNTTKLADMFIDKHSVELIREAAKRGPKNTLPDALRRTGAETGGTIYDPAGQR